MGKIPNIPHADNIFVIGDIHGCADEFHALLSRLPLRSPCALILLGDYIDRGPDSKTVIETLIQLSNTVDLYPIMGNHESSLLGFLDDRHSLEAACFLLNGGGATLQSYSDDKGNFSIPKHHIDFLHSLQMGYQNEKYIFVHAGLPNLAIQDIDADVHKRDLLWIRKKFFNSPFRWGKKVIHGHTPGPSVQFTAKRINVDTGCVFNNKLSAVRLPGKHVYEVKRKGTTEHVYLREPRGSSRKAVRFTGKVEIVIDYEGGKIRFNTINYNDFGLLIEPQEPRAQFNLKPGTPVQGKLETGDLTFSFRGKIVRQETVRNVCRYGVQFHSPPQGEDRLIYSE